MSAADKPVILCVDDATDLLALMSKALGEDYQVITSDNPGDGIAAAFGEPRPDLILLDIDMPDVSGLEVCQALKGEAQTADIPVVFLTARSTMQQQVEGFEMGAVDYITKPFNAFVLRARVRIHIALASRRHELEALVRERTEQLDSTRTELIRRLSRAMELHESAAVGNRVMRLGHYAKLISQAAGARPEVAEMMLKAAPLHDIGKLGVPAEILRKADKLSAPDWERIKRHPQLGAEIIGEHDDPLLKLARTVALTHHERWDGSGYPKGLKGEAIPWAGRVMAIVDTFESMTTTQFYRDAMPLERAEGDIIRGAGTKFDPNVVEAFKKALPVMKKVRETYADQLGDLINLDFAPKTATATVKPKMDVAALARAARVRKK
ncbi:MAG TPA: HD domain-containing phosphohydrolase [Burkholderiales bacterium]|nr:HD domain-containing phosphohydrolase [Burkholderiales bacterium]